ncbi:MAG: efflux RND transporter periplasmic adaptor subunit [Rhizobiaceae bacterium]
MRRVIIVSALIIVCVAAGLWYFAPREIAPLKGAMDSGFSAVAAALGGSKADAKSAARPSRGVAVATAVATTADFPIRRYAIGFVSSPAVVTVSARISSQVMAVHVKDGQMVKAGDLLFSLDDRALKAQLAKDQAALEKDQAMVVSAQADLKRAQSLLANHAGTQQAYDQADAAAKAASATVLADQAAIDADQVQLSYATITAPITGKLGAIQITKGNLVTTGGNSGNSQSLVTITQMNPLQATFSLPEADLGLLKKALASKPPATVQLYRDDGKTLLGTGELEFLDSTVDQASGTVQVKASMPNDDLTLWPGQFVDVVLQAGTMPAMTSIPTVAVQPSQKGPFVYVVKPDNTVDERQITVALTEGDNSAVSHGLKSGERVVTDGQARLKQGSSVRDMNATATTPGAGTRKVAAEDAGDGTTR